MMLNNLEDPKLLNVLQRLIGGSLSQYVEDDINRIDDAVKIFRQITKDWTSYYYPSLHLFSATYNEKHIQIFPYENKLIFIRVDLADWNLDLEISKDTWEVNPTNDKEYNKLAKGLNIIKAFLIDFINPFINGEVSEGILKTEIPFNLLAGLLETIDPLHSEVESFSYPDEVNYSTDIITIKFIRTMSGYIVEVEANPDGEDFIEFDDDDNPIREVEK